MPSRGAYRRHAPGSRSSLPRHLRWRHQPAQSLAGTLQEEQPEPLVRFRDPTGQADAGRLHLCQTRSRSGAGAGSHPG
jgi:hypothetical protein